MFYHITTEDFWSKSILLNPRVPDTQYFGEGNIPRICVSDSIMGCLRSILSTRKIIAIELLEYSRPKNTLKAFESNYDWLKRCPSIPSPSIYFSKEPAYLPPDYFDFRKNGEHWYVQPTNFNFYAFIDLQNTIKNKTLEYSMFPSSIESSKLLSKSLGKREIKWTTTSFVFYY